MLESHQESAVQPLKPAQSAGQIRYRSPSAAELEGQIYGSADLEGRMRKNRHEPPFSSDKAHRAKIIVLLFTVVSLVSFVFYAVPRSAGPIAGVIDGRKFGPGDGSSGRSYAVIFDAGSSGSRVHVYSFDRKLDLVPIGKELELFLQITPGLSSYAADPKEAANSLKGLLEKAEAVVPPELRQSTPVRVGATAGLRALGFDTSEKILQEVRNFIQEKSSLKLKNDGVTVLDGTQEGAYQWVTINYLLGNLGKKYSDTVGVVDLGGGSVQMAYAISEKDAANAPDISNGQDSYVKELYLKGTKYYLYVHSYLHYGLLAARAEILKADEDEASFCMLNGYEGSYKYGDAEYKASASTEGPSYTKCRDVSHKALKVDEPVCTHMKCTFGGVWNGGGGDGQKNLLVASFFFDRAAQAGFVDPKIPVAKVKPRDFEDAAKQACELNIKDGKAKYPRVDEKDLPYLCIDLVYQFTLLVEGFGLDPMQEITLVKQVKYGDSYVEAAWPLGSAIEVASSP